ncbi:flagellar L-ring protein precursor FlgH [Pseudaminobacter salicylatoxidans]|uniref:Flagellar L-ring protein n=1 Tax=Pseudaminobacter salicylatoxidans TaxID=93369 RepID=A0A316CNF6_PSESE|nr:flagellar basal body L-ring protein FlgH [Pseudaminobacter salicylatoxidans]PWJ83684.1 flagellar L-ring protein precursor FlgH [Pseudaminobacter salicylatoxidans]
MNRLVLTALAVAALSGCAARTDEIGRPPVMSPVGSGLAQAPMVYQYPQQPAQPVKRFSLWDDRQKRLFTDPRALAPGDILTVKIEINDRARFKNESDRDRKVGRSLGLAMDFGWNGSKQGGSFDADIDSKTSTKGSGKTERSETIELSVAAVVSDVLPNGNMLIHGSQEVRVNAELRILTIAGIVRPQDIGPHNTIRYDRIAEARISYGGRGRLTEVQQPPYGQQILDNVLPF